MQFHKILVIFILINFGQSVSASTRIDMDYTLGLEYADQANDEVYSTFEISLIDNYFSKKFKLQYDLTTEYVTEYQSDLNNHLWSGTVSSSYSFSKSLSWLLNVDTIEINTLDNNQLDNLDRLNSQTFITSSTGVLLDLSHNINGSLSFSLIKQFYHYDESDLDSAQSEISLNYSYFLNETSIIGTSVNHTENRYDATENMINDINSNQIRVDYQKRFKGTSLTLFYEKNSVDFLNRLLSDDTDGIGLEIDYQLNSLSSISFNASKELQQTSIINNNLIDPQNPLLSPFLAENRMYSLHFNYQTSFRDASFILYKNEVYDIADRGNNSNVIKGVLFRYRQNLHDKIEMDIMLERLINDIVSSDIENSEISFLYRLSYARKTSSNMIFRIIEGSNNGEDTADKVIVYELKVNIF